MDETRTELTVPNEQTMLRLVRAHVRELAGIAELTEADGAALTAAVEVACVDVLEHGFDPGERASLRVVAELTPARVTVAIHERGLPFEPDAETAELSEDPTLALMHGPRWKQIQRGVDEAHWVNRGVEGMELRLSKLRRGADVTAHYPASELTAVADDVPLAPEQNYTIRRLRPEEAVQVARVIYRTYGYTYPNEDVYYPERLVHLNETGALISIVAVDEAGSVVGHYALERPRLDDRVAESGQAVVEPAHRARRLMERMREVLEATAGACGLAGMYGEPVTAHTYSQHTQERFGGRVCGVTLAAMPRSFAFKHLRDDQAGERLSLMLYFKPLGALSSPVVHLPPHHRRMVEQIYAHLGTEPTFASAGRPPRRGSTSVRFLPNDGYGMIRVERVGADTAAEVRRARRDLVETSGCEALLLEVPLAQPGAAALCTAAEADGFFFSGIGPCFAADGDVLRLQYLTVDLDTAPLQILHPLGREILAYADAERQRVAAARKSSG